MRERRIVAPGLVADFDDRHERLQDVFDITSSRAMIGACGGAPFIATGLGLEQLGMSYANMPAALAMGGLAAVLYGAYRVGARHLALPYMEVRKEAIQEVIANLPPVRPEAIRQGALAINGLHESLHGRNASRKLTEEPAENYALVRALHRYGNSCTHGNVVNDTAACLIGWTAVGAPSWALGTTTKLQKWFHDTYLAPIDDQAIDNRSLQFLDEHARLDGGMSWEDYYSTLRYKQFARAAFLVAKGERLLQKAAPLTMPRESCFTPALDWQGAQQQGVQFRREH